jgi:hypothetical protein
MKYRVDYFQTTKRIAYIDADSCMEARKKFDDYDDVIDDIEEYTLEEKVEDVYLDE